MPEKLVGWTEVTQMRGIWRMYAMFLSPDKTKSAVVSLEDNSIIAIYNRKEKQMEYANPLLVKGVDLLQRLYPVHRISLNTKALEVLIARGIRCAHCKVSYISVEDFIERNPRRGQDSDLFIDSFCWDTYQIKKEGL